VPELVAWEPKNGDLVTILLGEGIHRIEVPRRRAS
jgi:hypothetical protein